MRTRPRIQHGSSVLAHATESAFSHVLERRHTRASSHRPPAVRQVAELRDQDRHHPDQAEREQRRRAAGSPNRDPQRSCERAIGIIA